MTETERLINILGGVKLFPEAINTDIQLFAIIKRGFPSGAADVLVDTHRISKEELYKLVITPRTLARRKKELRLSSEESDRLTRLARIITYASDVFGDQKKADIWLRRPNRALDNNIPVEMLDNESGARLVETVLANMEYGTL